MASGLCFGDEALAVKDSPLFRYPLFLSHCHEA